MNFAYKLQQQLKSDIFSQSDLKALLYPMTDAAIHNGISRSIKSKDLVQLKRGLYMFSKNLRKSTVSKFLIANKMYGPSYISFESALSYHGLIPERVYTTTSACHQRKSKNFENDLGDFSYEFVPCSDFFLGVTHDESKSGALLANPLRALFDLIYTQKKQYQSILQLEQDLRVNNELLNQEVTKFSVGKLEELAKQYKNKNVQEFYQLLIRAFKRRLK